MKMINFLNNLNDPYAKFLLGLNYQFDKNQKDYDKMKECYLLANDLGCKESIIILGKYYQPLLLAQSRQVNLLYL